MRAREVHVAGFLIALSAVGAASFGDGESLVKWENGFDRRLVRPGLEKNSPNLCCPNLLLSGSNDCHTRAHRELSSASSMEGAGRCPSECTKLSLSLTLSNCFLKRNKQQPIACGPADISTDGCVLREGCLAQTASSPKSSAAVEFGKRVFLGGWGSGPSDSAIISTTILMRCA